MRRPTRLATWLDRWGGVLPLLLAEFVVWVGFGGLLPVLPLYFTEQGIDLATLGIVIAAAITKAFPDVDHRPMRLAEFAKTTRICKLYDFDRQIWLSYRGDAAKGI